MVQSYWWKWGHMVWYLPHNNQLYSIEMREPITTHVIQNYWTSYDKNVLTSCMWEKVYIIQFKQYTRYYNNYVLDTLKPHNNQLFYAMKMGKPKDAINYRRIIYWRQWQYVLGTICTYYFDHHNNIEIHDIQNNSVFCKVSAT